MSAPLWVDTDAGFDDLWALLLLMRSGARIAGLSLVAGNAPLPRVAANARSFAARYGLEAPLYQGADRPLQRALETAERILGPQGMQSRGQYLPEAPLAPVGDAAVQHLADWLCATPATERVVLALGPLTNIAQLVTKAPEAAARITRLVWMGGSNGPGNHSAQAEFNALADPEAAAIVAQAGLPLEVIDLMICRQAVFGPADVPQDLAARDPLMADLLGGYLDIGLSRGRAGMAIYDPLAALAVLSPEVFDWQTFRLEVSTAPDDSYGATRFAPDATGTTRLAIAPRAGQTPAAACLQAFAQGQPE